MEAAAADVSKREGFLARVEWSPAADARGETLVYDFQRGIVARNGRRGRIIESGRLVRRGENDRPRARR